MNISCFFQIFCEAKVRVKAGGKGHRKSWTLSMIQPWQWNICLPQLSLVIFMLNVLLLWLYLQSMTLSRVFKFNILTKLKSAKLHNCIFFLYICFYRWWEIWTCCDQSWFCAWANITRLLLHQHGGSLYHCLNTLSHLGCIYTLFYDTVFWLCWNILLFYQVEIYSY